ncbi:hypothetical protein HPB48_008364 [Haemaphysalis longicornis]|uniref:THAP-type domain-containing protein n=1 Tax=Haemaphysalis longicornis TaxID=44386 RepID=A0A9J6G0J7_HAELO|nr:hypothetical protein HPB48_008364 [Haemaphysalis longicornis]
MSRYCAASGCQTKSKQGITLHRFPPDPQQRLGWTEFVRRSGRGNSWTPHQQSLLCSLYFAPSCYVHNQACLSQYSPQALRILEHGALPTISASPSGTTSGSEATSPKPRRLEEAPAETPQASTSADSAPAHSDASEDVQYSTSYEVPTASCSTSSACQTEMGIPELVLMKELREQCSSPVPSEPSFAFEDDPCDSTFEAPISDSSAM